ncbi:hypothetical protein MMC30_000660 [Trapelia coarctata]|nr:hypothetical protein [Trapelia coarctata]
MGFPAGFISGFTLTSLTLYLTISTHRRHRAHQAALLHQQSLLLNSIIDPSIVPVEDAPRFVVQRQNWTQTWKDRWNAEVEGAVRWAQGVRWGDVRKGAESRLRGWREGERRV